MNLGMTGAAYATAISPILCVLYLYWFFKSLKPKAIHFKFNYPL
jgi:Na+-driven multidrug efflux pump